MGKQTNARKRAVLKNEHEEGGLNITDIECLNRSLRLRLFILKCWGERKCHLLLMSIRSNILGE